MAAVVNTSKLVTTPLRYTSLLHRRNGDAYAAQTPVQPSVQPESYFILSQELFAHTLYVERKRTERSGRAFVLMLLESAKLLKSKGDAHALDKVLLALSRSSRDTDTATPMLSIRCCSPSPVPAATPIPGVGTGRGLPSA